MATGVRQESDPVGEQVRRDVEQSVKLVLHEIRQPLAAIFALAESARSLPGATAEIRDHLAQIIGQVSEVSEAAWSILDPATAASTSLDDPVNAGEVVYSVLEAFGLTWTGELIRRGDRGSTPVAGDRAAIRRCLVNVVDNAVRAAGPSGTVTVTLRRGPEAVRILVEDDGPGFGSDGPHGTGIGIEVTRKTLEALGGRLAAGIPSRTGGGAVALYLPTPTSGRRYAGRPARAV